MRNSDTPQERPIFRRPVFWWVLLLIIAIISAIFFLVNISQQKARFAGPPSRSIVLNDVKTVLHNASGKPVANMNDSTNLTRDLHLTSTEIQSLYIPFRYYANKYNPRAAKINISDCEDCENIDDCVKLLISKSTTTP